MSHRQVSHCCRLSPDTFIQKTKQRYNNPRSLSTKINLADMQTEIKLRPPYQLSPEDLQAINGFSVHTPSKYKGIGRTWAVKLICDKYRLHKQVKTANNSRGRFLSRYSLNLCFDSQEGTSSTVKLVSFWTKISQ